MTGFYYLSGPVTCGLVNHLGFQVTGVMGGVIAAVAFFFSTMTTSLIGFLIIFGVIGGCGFGLVYVPSVIVIGFYFEKWRALATSLAVTGSAAGIIGFPIIIEGILGGYDWRTKFRVIAAICLGVGALALLYRPLKPTKVLTNKDKIIVEVLAMPEDEEFEDEKDSVKARCCPRIFKKFHNTRFPTHAQLYKGSATMMYFLAGPSTSSILINSIPGSSTNMLIPSTSKNIDSRSEKLDKISRLSTVYEDETSHNGKCWSGICYRLKCCRSCCERTSVPNRPMYRDDIFYGGSLFTLNEYTQTRASQLNQQKNMDYTMSVTRIDLIRGDRSKCCDESLVRTLATMVHLQLLKIPSFALLAASGFFTILGMYAPFIYLVERADEVHITRETSHFFYTAVGVSNAVGRIVSGVISSYPKARPLVVTYVTLLICGISTICSYFLEDIYSHFAYCLLFGSTVASFSSLRTPLLVELLGLESLTNAFGILLLFNGVAGFCGVPIAGAIVSATNSFNSSFVFAGTCITLSAICLIPIKWMPSKANQN